MSRESAVLRRAPVLAFPGGEVQVKQPAKVELEVSALAWVELARQRMAAVEYFAQCGDRNEELKSEVKALKRELSFALRALWELAP